MWNGLPPRLRTKPGRKLLTVADHLFAPLRVETTITPEENRPNSTAYGLASTWIELTASPGSCTGLMPAAGSTTCAASTCRPIWLGRPPLIAHSRPYGATPGSQRNSAATLPELIADALSARPSMLSAGASGLARFIGVSLVGVTSTVCSISISLISRSTTRVAPSTNWTGWSAWWKPSMAVFSR